MNAAARTSDEIRIGLAEINAARQRIAGKVERTATAPSPALSKIAGVPVYLKMEHRQVTGSFKLRGASNAIALLSAEERTRGVVAASTGNHGRALAHAAKLEGVRAIICMSKLVPANKVEDIRHLGADVRVVGSSQDDAQDEVDRLVEADGLVMVPPFDNDAVIAGQGTLGLEMMEAVPAARTVLVQLSGGGLASGVAAAVKSVSPSTKVIGISMERGASMKASLDAGQPVPVEELPTLADSLGGGIGLANKHTFSMCQSLLDDVVLLTEDEIAAGVRHAYAVEREIVEGAGAVGIAAILAGKVKLVSDTVVLLSGRNIDMELHRRIVSDTWSDA
jgi:threonine dehydratase